MATMRFAVAHLLIVSAWLLGAFFPTEWLEALAPDPVIVGRLHSDAGDGSTELDRYLPSVGQEME